MNEYKKFRSKFKLEARKTCPFCDSKDFFSYCNKRLKYVIGDSAFVEIDEEIDIAVCYNCGLVFEDKIFPQKYYNEFFKRFYMRNSRPKSMKIPILKKYHSRMEILKPIIKPKMKVLDIGSWDGTFLSSLKKDFPTVKVKGIESTTVFYNFCREEHPELDIENKTLELFDTDEKFDLIFLGQVIRHFTNPQKMFKKLRGMLRPGGYIYFDSGEDLFDLYARENGSTSPYEWFSHEKRFYHTRKNMVWFLEKIGFNGSVRDVQLGASYNPELIGETPPPSPAFLCQKAKPRRPRPHRSHAQTVIEYLDRSIPKFTIIRIIKHWLRNVREKFRSSAKGGCTNHG